MRSLVGGLCWACCVCPVSCSACFFMVTCRFSRVFRTKKIFMRTRASSPIRRTNLCLCIWYMLLCTCLRVFFFCLVSVITDAALARMDARRVMGRKRARAICSIRPNQYLYMCSTLFGVTHSHTRSARTHHARMLMVVLNVLLIYAGRVVFFVCVLSRSVFSTSKAH